MTAAKKTQFAKIVVQDLEAGQSLEETEAKLQRNGFDRGEARACIEQAMAGVVRKTAGFVIQELQQGTPVSKVVAGLQSQGFSAEGAQQFVDSVQAQQRKVQRSQARAAALRPLEQFVSGLVFSFGVCWAATWLIGLIGGFIGGGGDTFRAVSSKLGGRAAGLIAFAPAGFGGGVLYLLGALLGYGAYLYTAL